MKKALLLITLCITVFSTIHAQTYSEKVDMYDTHQYVKQFGDPYNPVVAGVASYFIPGLGQMICDESSRGLSFLGGYVGCVALFYYGYFEMANSLVQNVYEYDTSNFSNTKGGSKMILGAVGALGVSLWSIVDAVHVAKVNNMYYQDHYKRTSAINLEIAPYAEPITMYNQVTVPVGLTLKATF